MCVYKIVTTNQNQRPDLEYLTPLPQTIFFVTINNDILYKRQVVSYAWRIELTGFPSKTELNNLFSIESN